MSLKQTLRDPEKGSFLCPICASGTSTFDSRPRDQAIRRRRICRKEGCRHRFTTLEIEVPFDFTASDILVAASTHHDLRLKLETIQKMTQEVVDAFKQASATVEMRFGKIET